MKSFTFTLLACLLCSAVFPQMPSEKQKLLDPRNYVNGMVIVDAIELQMRGSDITRFDVLDSVIYRVNYLYRYPEISQKLYQDGEPMVLEIGNRKTAFYSYDAFQWDSLYTLKLQERGPFSMTSPSTRFCIYGDIREKTWETINRMPYHSGEAIVYTDSQYPAWKIDTLTREIFGYHCYAAYTEYCGRKWNVWFTPEIPLSYGPWKLRGLPGLILSAEDTDRVFSFRCIGITPWSGLIKKYRWRYKTMAKTDWLKLERRMHEAPYTVFGQTILCMSLEKGSPLDDSWTIPYTPIELE